MGIPLITSAETSYNVWGQLGYRVYLPNDPQVSKTNVLFSMADKRHDLLGWFIFKEEVNDSIQAKLMDARNPVKSSLFGTRLKLPTTLNSPVPILINFFANGYGGVITDHKKNFSGGFARSSIHDVDTVKDGSQPRIRLFMRVLLKEPTGVQYIRLDMRHVGTFVPKKCFGMVAMRFLHTFTNARLDEPDLFLDELRSGI